MPRTVWEMPPGWTGDPKFNSPAFVRGMAEERHRQTQRKYFEYPLVVLPADANSKDESKRALSFRHYYDVQYATKLLEEQAPEDCRAFCFKDCPIFITTPDSHPWWRRSLFDVVYREWFPHRAQDCDISYGSFFGHLMTFYGEDNKTASLEEVLRFHAALCAKLEGLVADVTRAAPLHAAPGASAARRAASHGATSRPAVLACHRVPTKINVW